MSKLRAALATASVLAATGSAALFGATSAHANNGYPWDGCPDGDVCIMAEGVYNVDPNGGSITNEYYHYNTYNLSHQNNYHWVFNNQNGAWVSLCTGYNGTGDCSTVIDPGNGLWTNLTPINSIVLYH